MRPGTSCVSALACVVFWAASASADGLSLTELERLSQGQTVVRPHTLERAGHRYVGGVAYTVVDESAWELGRLLDDVAVWQRIVPKTRAARFLGRAGDDALVELTNGTMFIQATDTVRLRREGSVVRFWIDPSRRHDVVDAWGFVRADPAPLGRTLVTYGVLIDLGPGILQSLFEEPVCKLALSVPDRLRALVTERNAAGARAAR